MRVISPYLFRVVVYLITMASNYGNVHATCDSEQVQICRQAVYEDRLSSLTEGGKCIVRQYVQYTHLCTVSTYLPSSGKFCCCVHDEDIMCCKYHQDWNQYRCSVTEDTIGKIPDQSLPLEILLPVTLGSLAVLLCCIFCCVKCWCYKCEDEGDMCCCPGEKSKERESEKRRPCTAAGHYTLPPEERMPLTYPRYSGLPSEGVNTKLMSNHCNGLVLPDQGPHVEPSAPPMLYDHIICPNQTPVCISHGGSTGYRNSIQQPHCACMVGRQGAPPPCLSNCAACKHGGSHHGAYCCQLAPNVHPHGVDPATCFARGNAHDGHFRPSCAPPMYEDITKDELLTPPCTDDLVNVSPLNSISSNPCDPVVDDIMQGTSPPSHSAPSDNEQDGDASNTCQSTASDSISSSGRDNVVECDDTSAHDSVVLANIVAQEHAVLESTAAVQETSGTCTGTSSTRVLP